MATNPISQRSLPQHPNAEFLRKEAKRLARGQAIRLAVAQRRLAHDYGYQNWAALMTAVQARASPNGGHSGTNDKDEAGGSRGREGTPNVLPLLPLRGLVAFPHASYQIFLGRPESIKAAAHACEHKLPILLVSQRDPRPNHPESSNMYEVGTISAIVERFSLPDGTEKTVVEGMARARVHRFIFNEERFKAEAELIEEPTISDPRLESMTRSVLSAFLREHPRAIPVGEAFAVATTTTDGATVLADRIASESRIGLASKQTLLELLDPLERLEKLLSYLNASG